MTGVFLLIFAFVIISVLLFVVARNKHCNSSHMLKFAHHESTEFRGHEVSEANNKQDEELNRMNNRDDLSSDENICHNLSGVDDNNRDSCIEPFDNDFELDSKNSQSANI